MVVVEVVHLTSQHQSLAKAEVTPLQQDLNVPTVAKFTKEMFAQQGDLSVMDVTKGDTLRLCAGHLREPHIHPPQSKVVQEVQAQEDQNTGKVKHVDIVEMIRSMGLHEHQARNSQNVNVQEMPIVCELTDTKPVFHTPVQAQIVMTVWEQIEDHHGTRSLCSYTS